MAMPGLWATGARRRDAWGFVTAAGGWAYSRTVCTLWTRPFPDSRTPKESKARRD